MADAYAAQIAELKAQNEALARQVARLEDERAIALVLNQFSHYFDYGRIDDFADLLTEDAVWESRRSKPPHGGSWYEGRAAIRGRAEKTLPEKRPPFFHYKHNNSMPLIVVDGTSASAESYWWSLTEQDGMPALNTIGRRTDQLVKEAGRWRVRHVLIELEAINKTPPATSPVRRSVHESGCRICAAHRAQA